MKKLLSLLIAAAFAATTFSAIAADAPAKPAAKKHHAMKKHHAAKKHHAKKKAMKKHHAKKKAAKKEEKK